MCAIEMCFTLYSFTLIFGTNIFHLFMHKSRKRVGKYWNYCHCHRFEHSQQFAHFFEKYYNIISFRFIWNATQWMHLMAPRIFPIRFYPIHVFAFCNWKMVRQNWNDNVIKNRLTISNPRGKLKWENGARFTNRSLKCS